METSHETTTLSPEEQIRDLTAENERLKKQKKFENYVCGACIFMYLILFVDFINSTNKEMNNMMNLKEENRAHVVKLTRELKQAGPPLVPGTTTLCLAEERGVYCHIYQRDNESLSGKAYFQAISDTTAKIEDTAAQSGFWSYTSGSCMDTSSSYARSTNQGCYGYWQRRAKPLPSQTNLILGGGPY